MSRVSGAVALSIAAVLVAGCTQGPVVVTGKDDGGTVELSPGQTLEVRLEGNQTTGYSWEVTGSPAPQLTIAEQEYLPDGSAAGMVGAGGTFVLRFDATEPGENDLALVYARPWELGAVAETWTTAVVVRHP